MTATRHRRFFDTGLKWLGSIPIDWTLQPFWTLFRRVKRTSHSDEPLLSIYRDYGVVLKESRDDNFNRPSDDLTAYQLVEPGDLAINKMKAWQGSVAISDIRGIVSPAYFIYTPVHDAHDRYLHYLLRSPGYTTGYRSLSKGIRPNQWDLDPQHHSRMPVVLPPKEEQSTIANFLDRETAKIDTLIDKQERLIELLEEKRQAVITRAVTKGLNPDVRMKDSGVEWLGEVPEHWCTTRVRFLTTRIVDGPHFSPSYVDDGVLFISARNIKVDRWSLADAKYVSQEDYEEFCRRVKPERGDVLLTKGGTTGIARAVDLDVPFQVWVHVAVLKLRHSLIDPIYLAYALNSKGCYDQSQLYTRGATNNDLGLSRIANIALCLPTLVEQREIVYHLDMITDQIDSASTQAASMVELLRERRTSLISAAVTGKIDVRNAV